MTTRKPQPVDVVVALVTAAAILFAILALVTA